MSSRDYVIARLEAKGYRFEVLVKPDPALRLKSGEDVKPDELLVGEFVYKDVRKGLKASPEALMKVFGTTDVRKVVIEVVKRGDIQLTAEQRRRLIEQKRRQIISFISKNAVDPRTGLPIPPSRIETAMKEARVGVDPFKSVEAQAMEVIRAISRYLPIRIARALITVQMPPETAGKAYSYLAKLGELKKVQWKSDGSLVAELEIPAGMQADVIDKLNKLARGQAQVSVKVMK